jgi:transposase
MDKYRVALTEEERTGLEQLVSGGKSAARKLTHARILLLADEWQGQAYSDTEIVSALGVSLRTIERVRKRLVTEGFEAALDHRPQPPRPDKIKIKGNVEQKLLELACGDPPRGRCHWTLQLLVDELVVLGWVDTLSTVTVWQALKKMISNRGSSKLGVSHPQQMPSTSGVWKMCCRPISARTIHGIPSCGLL